MSQNDRDFSTLTYLNNIILICVCNIEYLFCTNNVICLFGKQWDDVSRATVNVKN